jgi:hypothetical protein
MVSGKGNASEPTYHSLFKLKMIYFGEGSSNLLIHGDVGVAFLLTWMQTE